MVSKKFVPLFIISLGVLLVVSFLAYQFIKSRQVNAGLKIETTPSALVFVNDQQVGKTPFNQLFRAGEATVKLVPESASSSALASYQTKIRLSSDTYTVIRREFADTDAQSSGENISLIPVSDKTASLSIVSSFPESATITVDDEPKGFTPLYLSEISPGDHHISISSPGYVSRSLTAQAVSGYKLTIIVKLAAESTNTLPSPTPIATASASPSPKLTLSPSPTPSLPLPYVTIRSTPTGFLRVRSGPSRAAAEIGQVDPKSSYPLLDSASGWYQIKVDLPSTDSGWISADYAQKFE